MSHPDKLQIQTSFQEGVINQEPGRAPINPKSLDNELLAIAENVNAIGGNLKMIQRDDGQLRDGSVGLHQLQRSILSLLGGYHIKGAYLPLAFYQIYDVVDFNGSLWVCVTAHNAPDYFDDGHWRRYGASASEDVAISAQQAAQAAASAVSSSRNASSFSSDAQRFRNEAQAAASATSTSAQEVSNFANKVSTDANISVSARNRAENAALRAESAASSGALTTPVPVVNADSAILTGVYFTSEATPTAEQYKIDVVVTDTHIIQTATNGNGFQFSRQFPIGATTFPNWSGVSLEYAKADGANAIGGAAINFSSIAEAAAYQHFAVGKQVVTTGYNFANDGGYATFVVADASADFGILTTDGRFKLQRTSGHDYLLRAVRSGPVPKIVAHRGFGCITAGEYTGNLTAVVEIVPENTRTAVRFAAEKGVWGVEGDTKITSDGVPVIFHDANLTRVSNGATSATIESLTVAGVKSIDAGTYVSPRYAGEKILTYDEWLRACKQSGVVPIPEWSTAMSSANADLFLSLVRKYFGDQPQNVVLMSTSLSNLQLIRSKDANISLMLSTGYGGDFSDSTLDGAYKLGNCSVVMTGTAITNYPATVQKIKKRGLVLAHAITNSTAKIVSALDAGADIIITDYYLG